MPSAVLLVEGDPTHQLIALSMLRHLGVEADAVSDATAAIERAAVRPYDLVLLGVRDGDDGTAVRDAIVAQRPTGRPRIVAVSNDAMPGATDRLRAAGFDGAIHKPLSVALLEEAVRTPTPAAAAPMPAAPATPAPAAAEGSLLHDVRAHVRGLLGEDDEEFVAELAEAFASSAQQALVSATEARDQGNAAGIASAAHALKGSASNVGLTSLTEAWGVVETGARTGDASAFDGPFTAAVAETRRALDQLSVLVEG